MTTEQKYEKLYKASKDLRDAQKALVTDKANDYKIKHATEMAKALDLLLK